MGLENISDNSNEGGGREKENVNPEVIAWHEQEVNKSKHQLEEICERIRKKLAEIEKSIASNEITHDTWEEIRDLLRTLETAEFQKGSYEQVLRAASEAGVDVSNQEDFSTLVSELRERLTKCNEKVFTTQDITKMKKYQTDSRNYEAGLKFLGELMRLESAVGIGLDLKSTEEWKKLSERLQWLEDKFGSGGLENIDFTDLLDRIPLQAGPDTIGGNEGRPNVQLMQEKINSAKFEELRKIIEDGLKDPGETIDREKGTEDLADSYAVLGLPIDTKDEVLIKETYRRLLSKNHPDKQTDASEEEQKVAASKTYETRKAYETIREHLDFT